ncbi:MAG: molybdopterin-binding protein [Deltaproteobacteria bacterium]|nr:molybdopterin-binding protein [Deltaproteobacteria bacterium]
MPGKYKSSAIIIPIEQAVGQVVAHDMTEIRPGQYKGPAFKKGHIITEADLPHLRRLGKENVYVLRIEPGTIHEDDAAVRLAAALSGSGVFFDPNPSEGKISLKAASKGLLKVNQEALISFNLLPEVTCASRHNNTLVEEGDIIAATRVIPLVADEKAVEEAVKIAQNAGGVFSVKKLSHPRTSIVITGNEVFHGLIDDKFAPILRKKLHALGCSIADEFFTPDDSLRIAQMIRDALSKCAELILVAGGMSVDPDDVSRTAILDAGAEEVVYGTPVLPGAMFLYGRISGIPVLGIPACVLFYKATVLDLILPRVLAGETVTRKDLAALAHGGLCLNCDVCRYPLCPFGK